MYVPSTTIDPSSLMGELIELLGELPVGRGKAYSGAMRERLARLEAKARTHSAPAETLAAIQGARVLMDLAELPPLPRDGLPAQATR